MYEDMLGENGGQINYYEQLIKHTLEIIQNLKIELYDLTQQLIKTTTLTVEQAQIISYISLIHERLDNTVKEAF